MRSPLTFLFTLALAILVGFSTLGAPLAHAETRDGARSSGNAYHREERLILAISGIQDGAHGSGNAHFLFLPPIAPRPASTGTFDASLLPHVVVEICQLTHGTCAPGPPLARFTSASGSRSERLRVASSKGHRLGYYHVNWHIRRLGVVAGTHYRIRVFVAQVKLGYADVSILRGGKSARGHGSDAGIVLVKDQTLPIKFRIKRGGISVLAADGGMVRVASEGGTITTADGGVVLVIPPGALSADTNITVQRLATFPEGPGFVVTNTVFTFGPAGTIFKFPVQVTMAYGGAALPAGADEGSLRLHKVIGNTWREVPGSVADTAAKTATGLIDGFSVYGVVTSASASRGPTISGFGTATIDGTLSPGEWDFAGRINFLATLPGGTTTPATLYVMNDATNLYLAVRFLRTVRDPGNSLAFAFDANDDGVAAGDDIIRFTADPNLGFTDEYRIAGCSSPPNPCTQQDVGAGGTADGQGVFQHHGTYSVYEMSHPLRSGDVTHDFARGAGQSIGFSLTLRLEDAGGIGVETTFPGSVQYGQILLQPAPVPLLAGVGTATVDGTMGAAEWEGAACLFLPINIPGGGTTPGQFCVMNDQTNLYVGLKFKRGAADPGNSFGVEFDNNDDGLAANGDDVIVYNPDAGFFDDFRTNLPPCQIAGEASCGLRDDDANGRTDGTGAFANDGTYSTYEMSHPLNSGDTGHDFALAAGNRVGFFLSTRLIRAPGHYPEDFADTDFPGFRNYARICIRAPGGQGVECALASRFLQGHPCVTPVLAGTPYNMADPAWLTATYNQNQDVCAYKFFAALHMLGYNTERVSYPGATDPHLQTLHFFQSQYGFPVSNYVTRELLLKLDDLLALREQKIAAVAKAFLLYDHMQPLHPNDVSKDWVAYIYHLPMAVLPSYLQMGAYETAQCIWGQCLGFLQDTSGANLPCQQAGCFTTDLNTDYRFVGAYFDPRTPNSRMPSAAVDVDTVLHEYAHYLDGVLHQTKFAALPHLGLIDTFGFNDISYDMSNLDVNRCALRRRSDPQDWISRYGFLSGPEYGCPSGRYHYSEEFAEAFMMYQAAGKNFRAAAQQNATIAQKYNWLKNNVFQGIEYDTDLQQGWNSGCNDTPDSQGNQPGYASCSWSYVWDGELRIK